MKIVTRNKKMMSLKHKQAKAYFKTICKSDYHLGYGEVTNELVNMYWHNGRWEASIYNSLYGNTVSIY
jgi:hypothetical protein